MNIEVQCCGIAILLLLWIFALRNKPLELYSVKLFLITMGVTSFCVAMDIISIVAINYMGQIPGFLLAFICKTYGYPLGNVFTGDSSLFKKDKRCKNI